MKIVFLIYKSAPFSHHNVYSAFKDVLPEVEFLTVDQFLDDPIATEWIFVFDHYQIRPLYRQLKSYARVAVYVLEDPYEIDQTKYIFLSEVDYVFTNDEGVIDTRRECGQDVVFLPLACRHTIFYPNPIENKKYKLVMIGNAFPNRIATIEQLSPFILENQIDFHVFGINWYKCKVKNPYIHFHNGVISETQLAQIYNASEATLEINRDLHKYNEHNVPAITPGRGFSSLGCACFTITDERPTSKQFFPEDGIAYYHSLDELQDLILLSKPFKVKIAKKGSFYVMQKHTFKHRAETLLNILS